MFFRYFTLPIIIFSSLSSFSQERGVPMTEELVPSLVEEYCQREPWLLTDLETISENGKFGVIPSRFLYLADRAIELGDEQNAEIYLKAAKTASRRYHKQMQASFQYLRSKLSRSELGVYAQELWVRVTRTVEHKGSPISRFIVRENLKLMDDEMRDLARERVYMNSKWLALNINEVARRQKKEQQ